MTQTQKNFIQRIGNAAAADMVVSGVLASLKIAQAIFESGWGTSVLATQANALFGIKADSRWSGRVFNVQTREFIDGASTTVNANFRAYDSWEHSNADHTAFLVGSPRYAAVIGERDFRKAAIAIHAAGYATDPEYADKLIRIIERHSLTDFDAVGKEEVNMNILQDFIPVGRRNRPGRVNPMLFVTIHNTGNTRATANARAHANYLKGNDAANRPASWHYTTDERDIYQHLPDNEDAFHAGDGAGNGNRQSIGIEICMNSDGDLLGATDNAILLTAHLCGKYNIPIENVVQHNHWSGKNCPQMIRKHQPYDWETFLYKVRKAMGGGAANPAPAQPPTPTTAIRAGDTVRLAANATYYGGQAIPAWVLNQNWIVRSVNGDRAVIDRNVSGTNAINSPVNVRFLTKI